jgi:hypothetical protein
LSDAGISSLRCLTRRSLLTAMVIAAEVGITALLPMTASAQDDGAASKRGAGKKKTDDGSKGPPFRTRGQSRHDNDTSDPADDTRSPRPVPGGLPGATPETGQRKNEP